MCVGVRGQKDVCVCQGLSCNLMGKGIGVGAGGQRGLKSPHFHRKRAEPPYLFRPDKMIISVIVLT